MARTYIRGGSQVEDETIVRADLNASTAGQAVIRKIIAGTNINLTSTGPDAGTGDVTVNFTSQGPAEALVLLDINLGWPAKTSGSATISGFTGLTQGDYVLMTQVIGPYTNKGSLADEYEMDVVSASASVISATQIKCYWNCSSRVGGYFKFNCIV